MTELSPDLKKAYHLYSCSVPDCVVLAHTLAEGLRDVLAELLEAEFRQDHDTYYAGRPDRKYCVSCGQKSNWNEYHNWQRLDWQGEAERKLREKS